MAVVACTAMSVQLPECSVGGVLLLAWIGLFRTSPRRVACVVALRGSWEQELSSRARNHHLQTSRVTRVSPVRLGRHPQAQGLPFPLLSDAGELLRKSFGIKARFPCRSCGGSPALLHDPNFARVLTCACGTLITYTVTL